MAGKTHSYSVFEVANLKRREIYVGMTGKPITDILATLRALKILAIRRWKLEDVGSYHTIEPDLPEEDARDFVKAYVTTGLPRGWRFLTD